MSKLFDLILGATIFLTATAYLPNTGMDTAQGVAFRVGIVALFIMSFGLKPLRFIVNKWLNALIGLCFVLTLILPPKAQAIALGPFINVFLGVGLFYLIANYAIQSTVLNAFCLVVIANAIMVIMQAMGIDPVIVRNDGGRPDMTGLFEYRYSLGIYMGILTPFLLSSKRKAVGALSAILTLCSMCYAAIIIMLVSCVIITYKTRFFKPCVSIAVICAVCASIYFVTRPVDNPTSIVYKAVSRFEMQKRFLPLVFHRPLGYGLGTFRQIGPMIANGTNGPWGDVTDAWSDVLERTIELGIPFLILFGFLVVDVFKRAGFLLLGIPANMIFHSCFNHFNLCVLFIVLMALWETKQRQVS